MGLVVADQGFCSPQAGLNPLCITVHCGKNVRSRLHVFFSATHMRTIRERATAVCIALQHLSLPALLSLLIIDELLPNDIRMWAKWELVTAVKQSPAPPWMNSSCSNHSSRLSLGVALWRWICTDGVC